MHRIKTQLSDLVQYVTNHLMAWLSLFVKIFLTIYCMTELLCSAGTEKRELIRLTEGDSLVRCDTLSATANTVCFISVTVNQ
jgi:hypothetical protein